MPKSNKPRFYEDGRVCCDDCLFDTREHCILNNCPTEKNYADAVALAEGELNH